MEEENKWEKANQLFDFLVTEDNEQGQLICLTCKEDITKNKNHTCLISKEQQPEFIHF